MSDDFDVDLYDDDYDGGSLNYVKELEASLRPFEISHPVGQEVPRISLVSANAISIALLLTFLGVTVFFTYDLNIQWCNAFYSDSKSLLFPSDNLIHLFFGIPFYLILSFVAARYILYLLGPVGRACEIWSLKTEFKWAGGEITVEEIVARYDLNKIIRFNMGRRRIWMTLLIVGLLWLLFLFFCSRSYTKVSDQGFVISTMFSMDEKSWDEVDKYRIALDEDRKQFDESHQPVFDVVFKDKSSVDLLSIGLYNTDPKLLMRLIDHLEWRGIEAESFTLETLFGPEDMGQLRDAYKKEIKAIRDYSKSNPYGFHKKHLENKSELFQSLYKDKGKTEHPGWTIKENDYQKELNQ